VVGLSFLKTLMGGVVVMGSSVRVVVGGLVVSLVVMGVLAGFLWVGLSDLRVKYGVLSAKYSSLEEKYGGLSSKYSELLTEYEGLKGNYTALRSRYVNLTASYMRLSEEREVLLRNYTSLKEAYAALKARYAELNSTYVKLLAEHKKLITKYEELKAKFDSLSKMYSSLLSNYTGLRNAYLSLRSEYGELQGKYSSLSSEYLALQANYSDLLNAVKELMNATKKRGGLDPSFYPKFIDWWSSEVMSTVKSINFGAYIDPYGAIYDWIVTHITYNYDTPEVVVVAPNASFIWWDDYWQYASETLSYGHGDCEDQAILAAAMVEAYWYLRYGKTYLIYVAIVHVKGRGVDGAHALLIIPFQGGEIAVMDPAAHAYVPPTKTLTALEEYEKLVGWRITYAYGVFDLNEYYEVDAPTLNEFAQWLDTH